MFLMKSYLMLQNCRSFYHLWAIKGIHSGEVKIPSFTYIRVKISLVKPHYINWTIMLLTEQKIQISYQFYYFPPFQAPLSVNVAPVTFYDWHGWKKKQTFIIIYTKKVSFQLQKTNAIPRKVSFAFYMVSIAGPNLNLCWVQISHSI